MDLITEVPKYDLHVDTSIPIAEAGPSTSQ
jgi:hypothetical protein